MPDSVASDQLPELWPVHNTDETDRAQDTTALCLSGGGFRAMLFHLGVLWRLNEAGLLPKLHRISSVSGGSIAAGVLATRWDALEFGANGIAQNFDIVVRPIREFARETVDVPAILRGVLLPGSVANRVATALRARLYGRATLQDLPKAPRFIFNATSLQSGVLFRFSKRYAADYRVGRIDSPDIRLADAIAASAAFPPFLSPATIDLRPYTFVPGSGKDLQCDPFTSEAVLTDGGVYDNLGLESAFKRCRTLLVSDGGGLMSPEGDPAHDWARLLRRVLSVTDNQVRSLRKRQLIAAYKTPRPDGRKLRDGAYWGIRSDFAKFPRRGEWSFPHQATLALANLGTRLAAVPDETAERLIDWGFAVSDAGLRSHVYKGIPSPESLPYDTPESSPAPAPGV